MISNALNCVFGVGLAAGGHGDAVVVYGLNFPAASAAASAFVVFALATGEFDR